MFWVYGDLIIIYPKAIFYLLKVDANPKPLPVLLSQAQQLQLTRGKSWPCPSHIAAWKCCLRAQGVSRIPRLSGQNTNVSHKSGLPNYSTQTRRSP